MAIQAKEPRELNWFNIVQTLFNLICKVVG